MDDFQDLTTPPASGASQPKNPAGMPPSPTQSGPSEKSIRNINVNNPARPRPRLDAELPPSIGGSDMRPPRPMPPAPGKRRWLIWSIALMAIVVLGAIALVATRNTTVTVTPRAHTITFTDSSIFTAVPAAPDVSAGVIQYSIQMVEAEDSAVVKASGTEHVDVPASGQITVFNNYSAASVKFVKNTRFETPSGFIFRVQDAISIPGKTTAGPGKLVVTVFADKAGEAYNVGPIAHFAVPGLKGGAEYDKVYASSVASTTGGFSGLRPAVAPADMQAAESTLRGRLESAVREKAKALMSDSAFVLPDLAHVTYSTLPTTQEDKASVRIHEKAAAAVPVFPAAAFAAGIARIMLSDVDGAPVTLAPSTNFAAQTTATDVARTWGTDPLDFTLSGTAHIMWVVDSSALAQALAGRDKATFQTIVKNFSSIEKATTRVMPFWRGAFPANASDIHINVVAPAKDS